MINISTSLCFIICYYLYVSLLVDPPNVFVHSFDLLFQDKLYQEDLEEEDHVESDEDLN